MNRTDNTQVVIEMDAKEANQFLAQLMSAVASAQTASGGKIKDDN